MLAEQSSEQAVSLALHQEFLFFSEGKEEKKLRVFFSEFLRRRGRRKENSVFFKVKFYKGFVIYSSTVD